MVIIAGSGYTHLYALCIHRKLKVTGLKHKQLLHMNGKTRTLGFVSYIFHVESCFSQCIYLARADCYVMLLPTATGIAIECLLLPWKQRPLWCTASIDFHCVPKWLPWQLLSCWQVAVPTSEYLSKNENNQQKSRSALTHKLG